MNAVPCPVDLNPLGLTDVCPVCSHRILAHDLDTVCAACAVMFAAGSPPAWWLDSHDPGARPPTSADPPISTR
jgi:hypothetical protein